MEKIYNIKEIQIEHINNVLKPFINVTCIYNRTRQGYKLTIQGNKIEVERFIKILNEENIID